MNCASFEGVERRRAAGGIRAASCATTSAKAWAGWSFLRRFGFGGCLADDMGVGKTAQVLALLETPPRIARRRQRPSGRRWSWCRSSLVFNWKQEAARFTPQLRVLDHTGLSRDGNDFADYDLILTTYGTLRRDAVRLKDIEFDYVVLDEAQAIKNASTESAKAVRLLRGEHRLALSGTPVENHLGELWRLFEFLNPGMLGAASVFKLAGGAARNPERRHAPAAGPGAAARSSCAAPRSRWRANFRPRPSRPCTASWSRRSASSTTSCAQHYRDALLSADRDRGSGEVQDPGAGGAAAPAPGRLPSRLARRQALAASPAPSWTCCWSNCAKSLEEGPQGAGVLAIHQPAGHRARASGRGRRGLRISGRRHPRPPGARGALPERLRTAGCS